jgi:protein TonB
MTIGRLAALKLLKPWTTPLALSLAVHGAIAALAFGFAGLFEPPRPETVIPVDLVFASGSSTASAAKAGAASDRIAPQPPPSSFPRKRESSVISGSPLSRGRRDECIDTNGSCATPPEPPPKDTAAPAKTAAPMDASLPDHAPLPPVRSPAQASVHDALTAVQRRAADQEIARMLDDAAAKLTPPIANAAASPPTLSLPHKGGGNARREPFSSPSTGEGRGEGGATRNPPDTRTRQTAALVPPGWGRPGLGNAPPVYPPAARRGGAEGRVVLRVRVDAGGHAETVDIVRSSGHDLLDEAARRAVAKWRFVPGRLAGLPVAASVDVPVVFRLTE